MKIPEDKKGWPIVLVSLSFIFSSNKGNSVLARKLLCKFVIYDESRKLND